MEYIYTGVTNFEETVRFWATLYIITPGISCRLSIAKVNINVRLLLCSVEH